MSASNKSTLSSFFKKNSPVILLCISINLAAIVATWVVYEGQLPENKKAFGVLFEPFKNFSESVASLEKLILDFRFRLRGPIKPSGKIGILAIDERSIQKFGRWPFTRSVYEQAMMNLKKAGAEWVGFDVVWDKPERPLLADALPEVMKLREGKQNINEVLRSIELLQNTGLADQSLARGFAAYGKVVQGFAYYKSDESEIIASMNGKEFESLRFMENSFISNALLPDGFDLSLYPHLEVGAIIGNIPEISKVSPHFGFFNNDADDDGSTTEAVFRAVELVRTAKGNLLPAISLKMAANITRRDIVAMFKPSGVDEIMLVNPENEQDVINIQTDSSGKGRALLNHLGPSRSLRHISLADAWDDKFSDTERAAIKGMSFMMGPTALAINDLRPSPFDSKFNGVEHHATMIDNIVSKRIFKRAVLVDNFETGIDKRWRLKAFKTVEMKVVLIVSILFSVIMVLASPLIAGAFVVLFYVLYYYVDYHLWFKDAVWVNALVPYLQVTSLLISVTFYRYITEEREKKKIKGAFQHYLSPDVMNQVLDDPEKLKLGGERRECSVFFSDVRGFTTISESLPPEKLAELMNGYLSPMTEIILRSGGVLDKYIGDAIMAFWGAPIECPDQADVAAQVVLRMIEKLEELRRAFPQKGFPPIDIGCGVNTGFMSVGNMGSSERFAYTVMGDAVNLGARLESITKEYGVRSIFSEHTVKKLKNPHSYCLREMDDIVVKGKKEPVKIFELIHPMIIRSEDQVRDLIGEFHLARDYYKQQKWDNAKTHLNKCLMIRPDDGPVQLLMKRIEDFQASPPGDDWNGVYVFHHK